MEFLKTALKTIASMWVALLWVTLPFSLPLVMVTALFFSILGITRDDIHEF